MEITEHQANLLHALADGETLQACQVEPLDGLPVNATWFNIDRLENALLFISSKNYNVRIKPDVIVVNGIEVPAPEALPVVGKDYYYPAPDAGRYYGVVEWGDSQFCEQLLSRKMVFSTPEAATACAKAWIAHKPG